MEEPKKKPLQWHPAFYAGLQIELAEDAENLIFENEHQLGTKPKQIDVLIIKKESEKPVKKNIGRLFRKYNIIEYKSPEDYLSLDDFYKIIGYACFYKADAAITNSIEIEELTVTYVCHRYPRKLMKHLIHSGYQIEQAGVGIYYIKDMLFPIQIILTSGLSKSENLWLSSLTDTLTETDTAQKLLEEYNRHKQDSRYESMMDLITNANLKLFKEMNYMCETLLNIMRENLKDEIDAKIAAEKDLAMKEGRNDGIEQMEILIQHLIINSRSDEIEHAVTDKEFQKQLFEEFGL